MGGRLERNGKEDEVTVQGTNAAAPGKRPKWQFTPAIDAAIRRVYEGGTGKSIGRDPVIRKLAQRLNLPRWKVSKRARDIGAYQPQIKEAPWSQRELHILELNAMYGLEAIRRKLKAQGFIRSTAAINLKRKRMQFREQQQPCSCRAVAACFGVDPSTVADLWIRKGLLKATRKGTLRTPQQGGDEWIIKDKDIKDFIVQNIGIIDLRKVDKWWFVSILTGDVSIETQHSAGQGEEYVEASRTNLKVIR